MRRPVFLACVFTIFVSQAAHAVSPDAVDRSIARARDWLFSKQKDDNWEPTIEQHGDQKTGNTALAVYALLEAGETHQEEHVARAIDYLKKNPTTGVYALGMRCQVWLLLPQAPDVKSAMLKDSYILLNGVKKDGPGKGFYGYNPDAKSFSHSRAQYGVLGMWAAAQAGVEVSDAYWSLVEKAWIADQDPSGAWSYFEKPTDKYPLTAGMTAVGVATLFITQEYLHANEGAACRGNIKNPHIDKGMKWITDNFDKVASEKGYNRDFPYSTVYAIERIGVASGYKYFKDIDWYDKGAEYLLKKQKSDGSWPGEIGQSGQATSCLAMAFLARGRSPVAMSKLDYTIDETKPPNWNQRPRDIANVSRWIGRQNERELLWQVVNLSAPVTDLHDSPILYLSGNEPIMLRDPDKAKLKQYIDEGGMLFANADCGKPEFATAVRKLGGELYPNYEFRELPADHPIYSNQQFKRNNWKNKPSVLALSNGVRELIVLVPTLDAAKTWQLQIVGGREEAWQLAADVFLYAVDKKNLRNRGDLYTIDRNALVKTEQSVPIVRLQYDGNFNPEPGGWTRISNLLHNRHRVDFDLKIAKVGSGSLAAGGASGGASGGAKIAMLTGTTKFKLDEASHVELKKFVDDGGTLIVDAAGGSGAFAQSAEDEIAKMFPITPMKPIEPSHPIFSAGGSKMPAIRYRAFSQSVLGTLKDQPRLQGIERSGRMAIIYSREDITAGLVGQAVDGIVGYDPETATELMKRILLYAAGMKDSAPKISPPTSAPTSAPTTKKS